METTDEGTVVYVGSLFKADYIRQSFDVDIRRVSAACGLGAPPSIKCRQRETR
jgi:hypothetical protein